MKTKSLILALALLAHPVPGFGATTVVGEMSEAIAAATKAFEVDHPTEAKGVVFQMSANYLDPGSVSVTFTKYTTGSHVYACRGDELTGQWSCQER